MIRKYHNRTLQTNKRHPEEESQNDVSEYYREIQQSHIADQPTAPSGRVTERLQ